MSEESIIVLKTMELYKHLPWETNPQATLKIFYNHFNAYLSISTLNTLTLPTSLQGHNVIFALVILILMKHVILVISSLSCDYSLKCTYKAIATRFRIISAAKTTRPEDVEDQGYCNPAYCHQEEAGGTSLCARKTTRH
jgi:hypothetical protein